MDFNKAVLMVQKWVKDFKVLNVGVPQIAGIAKIVQDLENIELSDLEAAAEEVLGQPVEYVDSAAPVPEEVTDEAKQDLADEKVTDESRNDSISPNPEEIVLDSAIELPMAPEEKSSL